MVQPVGVVRELDGVLPVDVRDFGQVPRRDVRNPLGGGTIAYVVARGVLLRGFGFGKRVLCTVWRGQFPTRDAPALRRVDSRRIPRCCHDGARRTYDNLPLPIECEPARIPVEVKKKSSGCAS